MTYLYLTLRKIKTTLNYKVDFVNFIGTSLQDILLFIDYAYHLNMLNDIYESKDYKCDDFRYEKSRFRSPRVANDLYSTQQYKMNQITCNRTYYI